MDEGTSKERFDMSIDAQVEMIRDRMFRHRFDQWHPHHIGWHTDVYGSISEHPKRKAEVVIREHLEKGHRVTAGYYPTSARGFRTYTILWKEKK